VSKKKRKTTKKASVRRPGPAAAPDRYALYELCAQNPSRDARMLRAIHDGEPRVLGEDFCGTAAISRAWVALFPHARAVGVDHDPEPLARARAANTGATRRVTLRRADVMDAADPADLIAVLNFSIGELHTRAALVRYLAHARARLRDDGVFIADTYDGSDAYLTGRIAQTVKLPPGRWGPGARVRYEWEQRHADIATGRVVNAMHFTVTTRGSRQRFEDAFVYDWRLWSVRELRDAMTDAGFAATEVYARTADATDADGNLYVRPVEDPLELGESFSAYVVGRK
jgi:SAM-dependent methyltransferase